MTSPRAFLPAAVDKMLTVAPPLSTHPLGGFTIGTVGGSNALAMLLQLLYGASEYSLDMAATLGGSATRTTDYGGGIEGVEDWSFSSSVTYSATGIIPELDDAWTPPGWADYEANFITKVAPGTGAPDGGWLFRTATVIDTNAGTISWDYTRVDPVIGNLTASDTLDCQVLFVLSWAGGASERPALFSNSIYPAFAADAYFTMDAASGMFPSALNGSTPFTVGARSGFLDAVTIDVTLTRGTFTVPLVGADPGYSPGSNVNVSASSSYSCELTATDNFPYN